MIYGEEELDLWEVVGHNERARQVAFESARGEGARWLVECRDMEDRFDADAGIYFVPCDTLEEVDILVGKLTPDNEYDRLMGIYNLGLGLAGQEPGLTRETWLYLRDDLGPTEDTALAFLVDRRKVEPGDLRDAPPDSHVDQNTALFLFERAPANPHAHQIVAFIVITWFTMVVLFFVGDC